jgi:thymidylate synthase ThyX
MRSWVFYLKSRLHESTQKEHRLLAQEIYKVLVQAAPMTMKAFFDDAQDK